MLRQTPPRRLSLLGCCLLLSLGGCRDRLAERRARLASAPLVVPPPQSPRPPTPDPALGDPWLDGRVQRNVQLPSLPYTAQLVGAECVKNNEQYALLTVVLLKGEADVFQELSHYGLQQSAADGTFEPPDLEHYPNFTLATTEVRDVNFDKQLDILIGDNYSFIAGIGSYAVWIFDTRTGFFNNSILPRIGKFRLDPEHSELVSQPWEAAQQGAEQIYSFARSPWVAEPLPKD